MKKISNFKSLYGLLEYFANQEVCIKYLETQLWGGSPACPHCGNGGKIYVTNRGYKCAECLKKFTVTTNTIFHSTKVPLKFFFGAIYLCTIHKKGISSCQLARDLGVTQKTAWFILHRVREMLRDKAPEMLQGPVEIDETFIGGKEKNKHKNKRQGNPYGGSGKTIVLAIHDRSGIVAVRPIPNRKSPALNAAMVARVATGATIYTDEHTGYSQLTRLGYNHTTINHALSQYVDGDTYTNNCENFFSHLKRGINGTHHSVSVKHLFRYCHAQAYRWNNRKLPIQDQFNKALKQSNTALPYKVLISND